MNKTNGFWTDEKLNDLKYLAKSGKSFSEAAEALNTTRNAVAGKALREGIKFNCPEEVRVARYSKAIEKYWASEKGIKHKEMLSKITTQRFKNYLNRANTNG